VTVTITTDSWSRFEGHWDITSHVPLVKTSCHIKKRGGKRKLCTFGHLSPIGTNDVTIRNNLETSTQRNSDHILDKNSKLQSMELFHKNDPSIHSRQFKNYTMWLSLKSLEGKKIKELHQNLFYPSKESLNFFLHL